MWDVVLGHKSALGKRIWWTKGQAAEAEEPNYPAAPVLRAGQAKWFLPGQSKVPVTHLHLLSTHGLGAKHLQL